jgi:Fe-S cluster assembly protein SufB/Fe-S cluster assembly protein SufD
LACLSEDGNSTIARNIIFADENSKATIVQEIYSPKTEKQPAYLELLNASVATNAQLDVTTLQLMDQHTVNFSTRRTDLAQDAKVNWYSGLFGSILSRYKIEYFLNGNGASANDSEVIFGNDEQSFDIQTNVNHESPSTEARVVEKSILRNKSKSLFKGMIRIKEHAAKSNSFLSGRSILLDKDAKSDAIPGLEIFTNDVKATHSASVAQIDEEQIFYLKTRCLTHEEAERTIVEGFLEPLSRKMSFQVRAWIAYLIESKWENRELTINTDAELAKFVEIEETRYNEDAEIEQHYKYR